MWAFTRQLQTQIYSWPYSFVVSLASTGSTNFIDNPLAKDFPTHPGYYPRFRAIDTKHLNNLGTEHTCDAYSYEGLKSLVDQGDGDETIARFISEEGWVNITDDNAKEMIQFINESFEAESNRQERERTMKQAGLK